MKFPYLNFTLSGVSLSCLTWNALTEVKSLAEVKGAFGFVLLCGGGGSLFWGSAWNMALFSREFTKTTAVYSRMIGK